MKQYTIIALFTLLTSSLFAGTYPDISIAELERKIAKKEVFIIDANGLRGYNKRHIPTSISFKATKDLAKALPEDKNTLIVAYCSEPLCSAYRDAADAAAKLGYTNIKYLSAGIRGWVKAGRKVEKVSTPEKK